MSVSKNQILEEIKRLAKVNGKPPGAMLFESETGIKKSEWFPDRWLRWGDALQEAGFTRNTLSEALSEEFLLEQYARLTQRLGRLPVDGEIVRESKVNPALISIT